MDVAHHWIYTIFRENTITCKIWRHLEGIICVREQKKNVRDRLTNVCISQMQFNKSNYFLQILYDSLQILTLWLKSNWQFRLYISSFGGSYISLLQTHQWSERKPYISLSVILFKTYWVILVMSVLPQSNVLPSNFKFCTS